MTLNLPLRVEDFEEDAEGYNFCYRHRVLRIVDANGNLVDGGPSYFDAGTTTRDEWLDELVRLANRSAAADKLAEACETLLMLSLPHDISGARMVESARAALAAYKEAVK